MKDKKNVRQAYKAFLQQAALSESELSRLENMTEKNVEVHKIHLKNTWLPFVAAALLFLATGLGTYHYTGYQQSEALEQRIVREVLTNHLKIKPLDLSTASIEKIQKHFDRLDFLPFLSPVKALRGLETLGGRYCTLQGAIALQVRLKTKDGNMATYYQSRYQESLFGALPDVDKGESPHVLFEGGVKLHIWLEKGTVSVLAQQS